MPIGKDSFEKLREGDYYYVDKTLLIKQLLTKKAEVTLITRPRRFGKSLNMSMLECFFDVRMKSTALFKDLAISNEKKLCEDWMNQYPTIFISFKDVGGNTYAYAFEQLKSVISNLFKKHSYLLNDDRVDEDDKEVFKRIKSKTAGEAELTDSLQLLSKLMSIHYTDKESDRANRKVIILIDEYDVPLSKGNTNHYYKDIVIIIRDLLSKALKTNEYLQMAVVTGCLRIAKESLFTGLNNPNVDSISKDRIDEYFGFTDSEVDKILNDYGIEDKKPIIKEWYDGYQFGKYDVYCPWDVINYVSALTEIDDAEPLCYWANTSGDDIIRPFLKRNRSKLGDYFTQLLRGETVNAVINERLTYLDLNSDELDIFWSLLYLCGYLTTTKYNRATGNAVLKIPNQEVKLIFEDSITQWFKNDVVPTTLGDIIRQTWTCDENGLQKSIGDLLFKVISFYDYEESFYHAFLAGILSVSPYDVKSNRENGEGRTDVTISDVENVRAAVFEFKIAKTPDDLEERAYDAIKQIDKNGYAKQLAYDGYREIIKIGIGYFKKRCVVKIEKMTN